MKLHFAALALRLLWSPNTEPDFSHYIVFTGGNPASFSAYQTVTDTFFAALESGRFYAVRAVDLAGNVSDFSEIVQFKENTMADSLLVTNNLRFKLAFDTPSYGIDPALLEVEHQLVAVGYQGQWLPLHLNVDWTFTAADTTVTINVPRLRSFLDPRTVYWLKIRMRYDGEEWIAHAETLALVVIKQRLKSIIPIVVE